MKRIIVAAALAVAALTYALPGDLLVISKKEVKADAAAGLSYLGSCASGYLYSGSAAALGRAAPYRTLDRDAEAKDYYVVWAPGSVKLDPAAFAHLGFAARLSADEILVGVEKGMGGAAAIRAVEYRTELRLLQPVTRVEWKAAAEAPPTQKDPVIEAAINTITPELYASYIQALQDFRTRAVDTDGDDRAAAYIHSFFTAQGLDASYFATRALRLESATYFGATGRMYLETFAYTLKRSADNGSTWDTIYADGVDGICSAHWLDGLTGFIAGYNSTLAITENGGNTWDTVVFRPGYPQTRYKPLGMYFVNDARGWLCGEINTTRRAHEGFILATEDSGQTWTPQTLPVAIVPGVIAFFDADHGWAAKSLDATEPQQTLYTADGGATWQAGATTPFDRLLSLAAAGPSAAWGVGADHNLYKTTDGLTWTAAFPGIGSPYYAVAFPTAMDGYVAGSALIATHDGGASWAKVLDAPHPPFAYLSFRDVAHGIVGNADGQDLYRTDDGGATFTSIAANVDLDVTNVIGERKGASAHDEIVIICGHFDDWSNLHPSYCPGAEDNASGTACAMAAASALKPLSCKRTVRYIAFDGEEGGLLGSEAYAAYCAAQGQRIVAVLNADMVAYDEDHGTRDDYTVDASGAISSWLGPYLSAVGKLYGNGLIYDSGGLGCDDQSFRDHGYAALGVTEGGPGSGGGMSYPYSHTTEDTLDRLSPSLGARFARDYAAMLAHLARSEYVGIEEPKPRDVAAKPTPRAFAVYPNPYRVSSSSSGVRFVGLATPAAVKVYDLAGRRVAAWAVGASAGDECTWRPAAAGGGPFAPGVYVYVVEGDNQREVGKLALVK